MKDAQLKELFLSKDELKFNTMIQEYILQMRKSQYTTIINQAPNIIGHQYNIFISILITAAIVFLNYDQLFTPESPQSQLIPFNNLHEIQRKVQYVFEHTLMKYTVLYPVNITQCESLIPFIKSDTLCSEKSVQVKIKFIFDIGYKPDYDNLQYDPNNRSITGEYGQLQILNYAHERLIESQTNGFMSDWSILEFENKYNQIKQAVKPKLEQRVHDYIQNYTQNSNSVDTIGSNIKKALMKIMKDKQETKEPASTKILNVINHSFDKLLILLSMDPLFFTSEVQEKNTFSEQDVTEFYKQQIIVEAERNKIQTQIEKIIKKEKSITQAKVDSKQQTTQSQQQKNKVQAYNSEEVRLKYKQLLKKIQ